MALKTYRWPVCDGCGLIFIQTGPRPPRVCHACRPAEYRRRAKARYHLTPARERRDATLRRDYGMGIEEYEALLADQGGTCALCNSKPQDNPHGQLRVDHCHETGRVRGLLCHLHNTGIGMLGDTVEGLEQAIKYLKGA